MKAFLIVHLPVAIAGEAARDSPVVFDSGLLSGNGVDPSVSGLFRLSPRFQPGLNTVELFVNGRSRGRFQARFDQNGALCMSRALERAARLVRTPFRLGDSKCFDVRAVLPQAEIQADPGEGKLSLVVPSQALEVSSDQSDAWQHGGVAGVANYDARYLSSSGAGTKLNFGQIDSEVGFNANDWIVRSRQSFSQFNGQNTMNHQAAYAQRTFAEEKKVLQVGQISLSNSMFGAGQILGLQFFPESALTSGSRGAGLVDGVARTQSVVEVRQAGLLLYSTVVPAGPFRLEGFSLLNVRTDLDVKLTGGDGQTQSFVIPAAALSAYAPLASSGLSFGLGQVDQSYGARPLVASVAYGYRLTPAVSLNSGVLVSAPYHAGALSLDAQLSDSTRLSLQNIVSQDAMHDQAGSSISGLVSYSLSEAVSVNLNASRQSVGYRDFNEVLQHGHVYLTEQRNGSRGQWGSGINWATQSLGSFSLSWARSSSFSGQDVTYVRGGWGRQLGSAYVGVNLERSTSAYSGDVDDRLYVSISIPLGDRRRVSSYLSSSNDRTRLGARYSERTQQNGGWGVSSDRDLSTNRESFTGDMDVVTPISQLSASISKDSENYSSWSTRASGGIVLHTDGVTFSPYRVGDTFGIARVGSESGVRLNSASGPVWTDGGGYAVLPSVDSFRHSDTQLDTRSLDRDVEVGNAAQELRLARGAVARLNFDARRTRRVLVEARLREGQVLPFGASVFNESNDLVTVVGNDSTIFVPDAKPGMKLVVKNGERKVCEMELDLLEKPKEVGLFENVASVCQPEVI